MLPSKTVTAWLLSLLATRSLGAVHEMLAQVPAGWVSSAAADSEPIVLQIGLVEQNIDQLESKLMSVSDPASPDYGNHLSQEELESTFAPQAGAVDAVTSWLQSNGVSKIQTTGSWVSFATDVGTANKLLQTKFSHFTQQGVTKLRTTQYSLPDDIQQHVDLVTPTVYLGKTTAMMPQAYYGEAIRREVQERADVIDPSCAQTITPSCIKQLYNINNYTPLPSAGSKIGFGSFLNQSARNADLTQFEAMFKIPPQSLTDVIIADGSNDQSISDNHGEADLDSQYIVGTAGPLPVTQFLTGGSPPFIPDINTPTNTNEPYLPYYQFLLSQPANTLPQVISNSYGDDEQSVPKAYAQKVCNLIGQMGLRGISVLESSGDTGVGAGCVTNDGRNASTFIPTFPASCPFVTSVGGLQSISPEVAWVASSGGFSNYFPRPSFQDAAVEAYLRTPSGAQKLRDFSKFANFAGRGFPDVSAHSLTPDYETVTNSQVTRTGGTSAAAPVFSSVIALLNDALLRAGKKPLGFLNPLLYSNGFAAKALTDITGGASVGCNGFNGQTGQPVPGGAIIPGASWNATVGWDPSTGLGAPNFGKMKTAVLAS